MPVNQKDDRPAALDSSSNSIASARDPAAAGFDCFADSGAGAGFGSRLCSKAETEAYVTTLFSWLAEERADRAQSWES